MARPLRIHVPGAFHHVTLRGNHRQPVFFQASDRELLGRLLAAGIADCGARVHAYCWMTNHVHLLVQVGDVPLGVLIHRVASRYARTVQAGLQTTGHLFENRFHAVMVAADAQLLALLHYIHLNPVRAGIVDHVAAYEWSSHHAYAGTRAEPWLTTAFLLGMLDPRPDRQRTAYARSLGGEPADGIVAAVAPADMETVVDQHPGCQTANPTVPCRQTLSDLLDQATECFGVTRESMLSPLRTRAVTSARQWIVRTALDRGIASVSEAARFLGRHESSLRKALARRSPRHDQ